MMASQTPPHRIPKRRAQNLRTALVLLSVALVFFVGIVLKYWLFGDG